MRSFLRYSQLRDRSRRTAKHRPLVEALEGRELLTTFNVTSAADSGTGTLRAAIASSNSQTGTTPNTINFNITGGGLQTINLSSPLPTITQSVVINGLTEPGGTGPLIVLNGLNAGSTAVGLNITASKITVQGLVIDGFGGGGVIVNGATNDVITNDYIGIAANGKSAAPNGWGVTNGFGVLLNNGASSNIISNDVISGNTGISTGVGVIIIGTTGAHPLYSNQNTVSGCHIGTNLGESLIFGNKTQGIYIAHNANQNIVGGTAAGASNVICGNGGNGIQFNDNANGNSVLGNFIGTNTRSAVGFGNIGNGVEVDSSTSNVIGGTTAAARNIISGNGTTQNNKLAGIAFYSANNNTVTGNYIGTDVTGKIALGNGNQGVYITGYSSGDVIGGKSASYWNTISGNSGDGVQINYASYNQILGNDIGTNTGGTAALANHQHGVEIDTGNANTIQGAVISGNLANGIRIIYNSNSNKAIGNFVGTNSTGTASLANGGYGIVINSFSDSNIIGDAAPGDANVISGNGLGGVRIVNNSNDNKIQSNFIGTNLAGTSAIANGTNGGLPGVIIEVNSNDNTIGGVIPQLGNTIAGNQADGILITSGSSNNFVQQNFIGTNASGAAGLGNGANGVEIGGGTGGAASGNFIGGFFSGNVISGNNQNGIAIDQGSSANYVMCNNIGTTAGGAAALGNALNGILIGSGANNNIIGGTYSGQGNTIAANGQNGVVITDATTNSNLVEGSFIGTNSAGATNLGNALSGVLITSGAYSNTIGGTATGAGNTISYNLFNGLEFYNAGTYNIAEYDVINSNGFSSTTPSGMGVGVYIFGSSYTTVINSKIDKNRDGANGSVKVTNSNNCTINGNT